ncbi:carotenoid oxygenase family protein [Sphingomonas sp. CD22]|uniref:carotenoid oxygenase family protein n=1 Tax=Sphingomonas sp. CD22 TaxID=3100214 RepID=UPI002ADFE803|nr:carotenoid oxygenase family protein [Sphingomonas sp. CD22]MEA1086320.1 carotenoid oxygenase family protein [Sphingomonas sp. CD22]
MFGLHHEATVPMPATFTALRADTQDRAVGEITVRGKLPEELTGVLFRNGPDRFRRDSQTKRTVLDGDGVVQRLEIADGRRTGSVASFDFGADVCAGEPVFAADPNGNRDEGWLITQTLDVTRGTSGFAILDTRDVAAGPVAVIELGRNGADQFPWSLD